MRDFLLSIGYNYWILPALLAIPLLGALLVAFTGRRAEQGEDEVASGAARAPHRLATAFFALEFLLSLGLWWAFEPGFDGWQQSYDHWWIPSWGIRFTLGLDGIAFPKEAGSFYPSISATRKAALRLGDRSFLLP